MYIDDDLNQIIEGARVEGRIKALGNLIDWLDKNPSSISLDLINYIGEETTKLLEAFRKVSGL